MNNFMREVLLEWEHIDLLCEMKRNYWFYTTNDIFRVDENNMSSVYPFQQCTNSFIEKD